jgi:hypothetical protein
VGLRTQDDGIEPATPSAQPDPRSQSSSTTGSQSLVFIFIPLPDSIFPKTWREIIARWVDSPEVRRDAIRVATFAVTTTVIATIAMTLILVDFDASTLAHRSPVLTVVTSAISSVYIAGSTLRSLAKRRKRNVRSDPD